MLGDTCRSCGQNRTSCSCNSGETSGIPGVNNYEEADIISLWGTYWEGDPVGDFSILQNDRGTQVFNKIMAKIRTIIVTNNGRIGGTLTDATSIPINLAVANVLALTTTSGVGASRIIQNPTNPISGQLLTINVTQGVGSPHTIVWGSKYKFPTNMVNQISDSAGKRDKYVFEYNSSTDTMDCIACLVDYQ